MDTKNYQFSSGWGFVLSAAGSAVGMVNVWGFPAKMGSNGGGAFLLAYLFFIILFGTVGLSAEYAVGRRGHAGRSVLVLGHEAGGADGGNQPGCEAAFGTALVQFGPVLLCALRDHFVQRGTDIKGSILIVKEKRYDI